MATTRKIALAFAGPGDTTLDNATDLLNDHLGFDPPDADGLVEIPENLELRLLFPISSDHLSKGLETVLDWTDEVDLDYEAVIDPDAEQSRQVKRALKDAERVHESPNVNAGLMDELRALAEEGYETRLVLLWGDDDDSGDDNAETLLDLASTYDIKALDLTKGLEDISFSEEDEPLDKVEEAYDAGQKGKTEQPKRRSRSKPAEELKQEDEPLEDEGPSLEEEVSRAAAATAAQYGEVEEALDVVRRALNVLQYTDETNALLNLGGSVEYRPLTVALAKALATLQEATGGRLPVTAVGAAPSPAGEPEKPRKGRGRPRKDGSAAQPRSPQQRAVKEYYDEDEGDWVRSGRGRIPKGVKTRKVDPVTGDVVG